LADDDDVLGKADALLRRRSVAPPADGSQTGGVPVLTDLVGEPPGEDALTSDVAREVFDRVIGEVERRLTAEIERRVAERLAPEVNSAVVSAIADLRPGLAKAIGDAVADALAKRTPK
jgi:hypothetical protein